MNKKFGFGYLFPVVAVTAVYSKSFVDFSEPWLSCLIRFVELFVLNFALLGVVYALGNTLDDKIGEKHALGAIIAAAVFGLAFLWCLIYKR